MPKKILFIEDEPVLQKTFGDALAPEDCEVVAAIDGETGLRLAQSEKPDLILLDLILPRLHGLEVLKKLKEAEATRQIPVIILTNLEDVKNIETALELGATTYLVKANYSLNEIVDKVKKALSN
ncbi:MAG: response regulator [Candidatus Nealsonbacteria bacterium]|nr:response regulator [Candidatus Nealsonbacteria bacterium]